MFEMQAPDVEFVDKNPLPVNVITKPPPEDTVKPTGNTADTTRGDKKPTSDDDVPKLPNDTTNALKPHGRVGDDTVKVEFVTPRTCPTTDCAIVTLNREVL